MASWLDACLPAFLRFSREYPSIMGGMGGRFQGTFTLCISSEPGQVWALKPLDRFLRQRFRFLDPDVFRIGTAQADSDVGAFF